MFGKWVHQEGPASEVYEGMLVGPLESALERDLYDYYKPNMLHRISHKKLDKVHIRLEEGSFEAYHPFGRACRVVFEKGLDSNTRRRVNEALLDQLYSLEGTDISRAMLYTKRTTEDGIDFYEFVRMKKEGSYGPIRYQICVQLPDEIITGREKYGEYECIIGKDSSRIDALNSICEVAEKEGFRVERKYYDCFQGACICPKTIGKNEISEAVSHLMLSPKVNFKAESGKLGIRNVLEVEVDSGDDAGIGQNVKLELFADKYYPWKGHSLLGRPLLKIIDSSGAKVAPDAVVSLEKYEKRRFMESAGGYVSAGLGMIGAPFVFGLGYASGKWDDLWVWFDEGKTHMDRSLHPKRYLISDTLKEGNARGGEECSCLYLVDPTCMTNRQQRKMQEEPKE